MLKGSMFRCMLENFVMEMNWRPNVKGRGGRRVPYSSCPAQHGWTLCISEARGKCCVEGLSKAET